MSAKKTKAPRPGAARLLIVDDHELARAGLRSMLARASGLDIIGEASNTIDALALCAQLQPDLVLMDIRMQGKDSLDAIGAIRHVNPGTKVIVLTIDERSSSIIRAMEEGASGYVLKDVTRKDLLDVVRRVLAGGQAFDSRLTLQVLQERVSKPESQPVHPIEPLTSRERDVLRLIGKGLTNAEIGDVLGIGKGTVKSHVQRIIAKLGVTDRTQAAVLAVQLGLIDVDRPPTEPMDS